MRKLVLLLFFALAFSDFVNAQVASDCTVPQLLIDDYERDIKNLALRRIYQVQSPDIALIRIPQYWQDTIAEGLTAILNATSIPQQDTIFNLYCIHDNTSTTETLNQLLIEVDTSYAWVQEWQNLNSITGNAYIDSLVVNYGLNITQFYNWSFGKYALVQTDSLWNVYALIDSLKQDPGVINGELDRIVGDAGRITYDKIGDDRYYDFYLEFNDCFDGCNNYRRWRFKVNSDCSVEYLGHDDWGFFATSIFPTPVNCNIFVSVVENDIQNEHYILFPNPTSDLITIKGNENMLDSDYFIIDLTGREVLSGQLKGEITSIDISQIKTGVYFLRIGQQRKQVFKVIKK